MTHSRGSSFDWNPEADAKLRRLWDQGLKASAIGDLMHISKNSVLGRVRRLGFPGRANQAKKCDPNKRPPRPPLRAPAVTLPALTAPTPTAFLPVAVIAESAPTPEPPMSPAPVFARSRLCSYPLWADGTNGAPDYPMCGAAVLIGRSYCADHQARCCTRALPLKPPRDRYAGDSALGWNTSADKFLDGS